MEGRDTEQTKLYIDKITAPGISNEQVMTMYSEWAKQYEHDVVTIEYGPPKEGAKEIIQAVGDRGKDVKILDCGQARGCSA